MKFERPVDTDALASIEGTVIIPNEDREYPDELFQKALSRSHRGASNVTTIPLMESTGEYTVLDMQGLAQLLWEHRQYSRAQGFSPAHMEVLRVVQSLAHDSEHVLFSDIKARVDYPNSTISQALTTLEERGLVKRLQQGVIEYQGFDEFVPNGETEETEETDEQ